MFSENWYPSIAAFEADYAQTLVKEQAWRMRCQDIRDRCVCRGEGCPTCYGKIAEEGEWAN